MIKFLPEIRLSESNLYGGKGASLGELMHAGMPVPQGFVLPSTLTDLADESAILAAFEKLNTPYVAVRSSANAEDSQSHSFAGQFATYLFVDKHSLIDTIRACRNFLGSERIKAYCTAKRIDKTQIKLAIVVQEMIPSDIAGVCFTTNPVTGDSEEIIIEACLGLGEALVSGKVTPDRYSVKQGKITHEINSQTQQLQYNFPAKKVQYEEVETSRQNSQKLDDTTLETLVSECRKIVKHYGKPMDIEWAVADRKVYILQARPITTTVAASKNPSPVNPREYDHLWDWGAPYLIASIDQETFSTDGKTAGVWDFISYGVNGKVSLHISKKDRKILSDKGLSLYTEGYDAYETQTRKDMQIMENLARVNTQDLSVLSTQKLADTFERFILQIYTIFQNFDPTEYMYTDRVEQILIQNDEAYDIDQLRKNVEKMGTFKLEQRALMNIVWDYQKGPLADYLKEIKQRVTLKYPPEQYHYKELLALLSGKTLTIPDRSIWIRGKFSSWRDIVGEDAHVLIQGLSFIDKDTNVIQGTSSNRGLYTGRVKKIEFDIKTNYDKEISEMKKGEVLVSGSTGPEMILACQKAGAIITEEGGVISHAAIISRELGIPCITGTHIACKVLENGDLVEVDAYNGVVKILERAART